jgi:anti-sigma regulatory factor (Ser/Thr protein kinase)
MTTSSKDTSVLSENESFVHPALFYRSDEEYLAGLVPFITGGLDADEPVAVAVPASRLALLRGALGAAAHDIKMINMGEAGRNPGRIIAGVLRRFADAHPDRHVRIIGEPIWPGRTAIEYPACVQHEALINPAFAGRNVTIVCPYDTIRLDDYMVADAYATHPVVWQGDQRFRSDRYDPDGVVAKYNQPLNDAPDTAFTVSTLAQLPAVRQYVADHTTHLELDRDRLSDLQLVAHELMANSLVHGQGPARLRLWTDSDHLVCEARDNGRLTDPLAGRRPPEPGQQSGRGLLLVHALADLVRTHTGSHGTTIRALFTLPKSAPG